MARKKRKNKKIQGRFVALPHFMLEHPAFLDLSTNAVRVLIELKRRFNGQNNGEIHLSRREAKQLCKSGLDSATKAFEELITHGFINYKYKGMFTSKRASEYKLTFEDINGYPQSNDWKQWPNNKENKDQDKYLNPYFNEPE